jgi:hypothetical protein
MSGRARSWALVCVIAAAGCGGFPTAPGSVGLTTVIQTDGSGFNTEATTVVTDQTTWQSVWQDLNRGKSPIPALPSIDFGTEIVLVVTMGAQPSSGYVVTVESARFEDSVITVDVTMTSPGTRCVGLTVVTGPVHVVRLTRPPGRLPTVKFRITRRTRDC